MAPMTPSLVSKKVHFSCRQRADYAAKKDSERVADAEETLRAALSSSDEFAAARAAIARRRLDDARECAKVSAWMAR